MKGWENFSKNLLGSKMTKETIIELATGRTKESDVTGSATSSTALEPTIWLKQIVDAAKKRLMFMQALKVEKLKKGQKDLVIPYRSTYLGSSGISYTTTTPNDGTAVTATKLDNFDGVTFTPTLQASRFSIGNYAIETNAIPMIDMARDELIYSLSDKVDAAISTALGDASSTTSAATGMQTLYGGDATSDNTLETGDILTTDLIAEGRKLLMDVNKQYRASTGTGGGYGAVSGTVTGNPWSSSPDEPFILFIGPAQEEALLKDSQFVNASEYGSNEVILNGEVGKFPYLGVKVVSTNNVERVASGSEGPDAETANAGAAMTRCLLVKSQRCGGFVWGYEPRLKVWDNAPEIATDIILETAYDIEVIHGDAIVAIDVSDS